MSWRGRVVETILGFGVRVAGHRRVSLPPPEMPRTVLVIRASDLGDLLTTTPILQALRCRFPKARLIAGVGRWGRPVLENNPYIDEVVELDVPWNNKFVRNQSCWAVGRFLGASDHVRALRGRGGFDVGIDVQGTHLCAMLMMRLGVRYRVGVRGYRGGWSACHRYIRFSEKVHVARAALAQAELLGATDLPDARPQLFLTEAERTEAARLWGSRSGHRPRLLVGCGGGLEEKCWPPTELGEALRLVASGDAFGFGEPNVILVGGPQDRERGQGVLAKAGLSVKSICGETSLRTTFALTEQADVVLTNASMLLHAAAAFRRPTVAVLGGMYGDRVKHDLLWGYPPPYESVGPRAETGSNHGWPSVERVVAAVIESLEKNRSACEPSLF